MDVFSCFDDCEEQHSLCFLARLLRPPALNMEFVIASHAESKVGRVVEEMLCNGLDFLFMLSEAWEEHWAGTSEPFTRNVSVVRIKILKRDKTSSVLHSFPKPLSDHLLS